MPAPKAVLRDIHDHGLDPSKPHGRLSKSGRLVSYQPVIAPQDAPVAEKQEAPAEVAAPQPPVAPADVLEADDLTVVASSKKSKKAKADKPVA